MITIARWNEQFECADSRKRKVLKWHQTPTGTESSGLVQLRKHGIEGLAAFGVFGLLCQLHAATEGVELRMSGTLSRTNGRPLTDEEVADKLRIDVCHLSAALLLLKSDAVQWICHQSADDLPPSADDLPSNSHDLHPTLPDQTRPDQPTRPDATLSLAPSPPDLFDEFWAGVPTKIGKEAARKAWKNSLKRGVDPQEIIAGLPKYHAYEDSRRRQSDYMPLHPATWINQGRWEDVLPVEPEIATLRGTF